MHHTADIFFDGSRRTKCLKQIVQNFPPNNKLPKEFYQEDENAVKLSAARMYEKCRCKLCRLLKFST